MENQLGCNNVEIIDENFYMPQLDRHRRIWIYKPVGYGQSDRRYPVIYMHDGQNLFDEATAFGDEWCVDETLNEMNAGCIVIGVDSGEKRLTEYNFRDHEEHGEGEGFKYATFIAETLKPFVDENFATLPGREHTFIAGSSMGGLISLYIAVYFPHVFGGAGVFSPSLWLLPDAREELEVVVQQAQLHQRIFLYGGAKEDDMLQHIDAIGTLLHQQPNYEVEIVVDPEGEHAEYRWRQVFPLFYKWMEKGVMENLQHT